MTKLIAGLLLLAGVLLVERGLHKPRAHIWEFGGWLENHRDGGGV